MRTPPASAPRCGCPTSGRHLCVGVNALPELTDAAWLPVTRAREAQHVILTGRSLELMIADLARAR